jgi:hypothetical protein
MPYGKELDDAGDGSSQAESDIIRFSYIIKTTSKHKEFIMKWITTIKERIDRIIGSVKLTIDLFIEWFQTTDKINIVKETFITSFIVTPFELIVLYAVAYLFGTMYLFPAFIPFTIQTIVMTIISMGLYYTMRDFRNWFIGIEEESYDDFIFSEDERMFHQAIEESKEYFELKAIGEEHRISDKVKIAYKHLQDMIDDDLLDEAIDIIDGNRDGILTSRMKMLYQQHKAKATSTTSVAIAMQ